MVAVNQTQQYGYAADNRLASITYQNPVNPTPNVGFAYDPYFPRRTSMTDGTGTTQYSYVPVGTLGALRLQQEQGALANSAIAYGYDALGRLASRSVAGAGTESFGYDAVGRLTGHTNDLGSFTLSYLGQTGQITQRQLSGSTLQTAWGYLPNSGDRRLASIANTGLSGGQFSNFSYTTTPENLITSITESSDAAPAYPGTGTQTAAYNNLNQLTNLSGQTLTYDADGNLLSDVIRNYAWDAENRLVKITYPGQPGTQTTFAYDGLGRRTAITNVAGVTTSYLWCGSRICQARNSANATIREYYPEGEYVPGSPAQPYYYGPGQIGSVRRAFASTSNAPAYGYDPYGVPLQATAPLTDFVYAGMSYNADSGIYLTQYRAYNPVIGRWLSRDPIAEGGDPNGNLYRYVQSNPVGRSDILGLALEIGPTAPADPTPLGPASAGGAQSTSGTVGPSTNCPPSVTEGPPAAASPGADRPSNQPAADLGEPLLTGGNTASENDLVLAAGGTECQGPYCGTGGSYGTTAMYRIGNQNMCYDCAVKVLGLENQPAAVKIQVLQDFIRPAYR